MRKSFLLIFIILLFENLYCYIVFNLKLLPKENSKTLYELNSPKDIISKELISSFYSEINIGTQFQKIPILIKPKIADYIITSIHQMEDPKMNYPNERYIYNLSPNFLSNYKYYDEDKSETYKKSRCEYRSPIGDVEKPLSEWTCYSNETISLYTDIDIKEKKNFENFEFELIRNARDNITGIIGLNLNDFLNHVSFISLLKKYRIIDNYLWYYDFEKWNSTEGKLIIGAAPHDIRNKKFSKEDLIYTSGIINDNYKFYQIKFKEVYFKNITTNEKIKFEEETNAELNLDSNVIIGTRAFERYLNSILNDSFNSNDCFFEDFKNYYEPMDNYYNYKFIYCKNNENMKEKLYQNIPDIYFYSKQLNHDFELKKEQFLVEDGDYIYIYIIFCYQHSNFWYLGRQISLKYQFIFNLENKNIYFYKKQNQEIDENNENNNYLAIKIISAIVLCIILVVLGIFLGKKLYGIRKKRANELNDDDFEYFEENNSKDVLGTNT